MNIFRHWVNKKGLLFQTVPTLLPNKNPQVKDLAEEEGVEPSRGG